MWPAARQLCGTRVSLHPLSHSHANGLVSATQTRSHLPKDCAVPHRDDVSDQISYLLERQADGLALPYCVLAPDKTVLGISGFSRIDRANKIVEIGDTWLSSASPSLYTEMMTMLLTFALEVSGALTVQMRAQAAQSGHRHLIETLGAELDGVLRGEKVSKAGKPIDIAVYSILAMEWPVKRAKLLEKLTQ